MDLLFNFLLSAHIFATLATERASVLEELFAELPDLAEETQWANFLRNYDELNLGRLRGATREATFERFAPDEDMRIYGRGIRRRLAPMLDGDQRRLELAFSLLFSLPGAPLLVYGDEIGMGEDLSLPGRTAVRTPMQWSDTHNAGFSDAAETDLVRPVLDDGPFGYEHVNVADQWADEESLLNFAEHLIGMRRETPEIGLGALSVLETDPDCVFAHRGDHDGATIGAAHNLADEAVTVTLDIDGDDRVDLLGDGAVRTRADGGLEVELEAYGYRWIRVTRAVV